MVKSMSRIISFCAISKRIRGQYALLTVTFHTCGKWAADISHRETATIGLVFSHLLFLIFCCSYKLRLFEKT